MNTEDIRQYCLSFQGATEKLQWGDALCFKVRGKMFAVLGLDNVRLTFKATPDEFAELVEREHFQPSPYVARYHWVLLERIDAVTNTELKQLIQRSYELVEAKAPRARAKPLSRSPQRKLKKSKSTRGRKPRLRRSSSKKQ